VINEVNYHPLAGGDAFIELLNISGADVLLYDPVDPADTWQITDGVGYAFPTGTVLPAGARALVVALDPTAFRDKYQIPASVQIFGPYDGSLENSGELISLKKPGDPQPPPDNTVPYYLVDHVAYGTSFPWPTSPDGHGTSLERAEAGLYGNDPANWMASQLGGTAGLENSITSPRVLGVQFNDRAGRGPSAVDPSPTGVRTVRVTFNNTPAFAAGDVIVQAVEFNGASETVTGTLAPAVSMAGNVMTLTLAAPATDAWIKVTLRDSGTFLNAFSGRRLDGEPRGGSGRSYIYDGAIDLPTGNGQPGGSAVFYVGSLRGDFSGGPGGAQDLVVTEADIDGFLAKVAAGGLDADFRGVGFGASAPDGLITTSDFDGFISAYQAAVIEGRHLDPLPNPGPQGGSPEPRVSGEPLAAGEPEGVMPVLGGYPTPPASDLPAAVAAGDAPVEAVGGEATLDLSLLSAADLPQVSLADSVLMVDGGAETAVPLASAASEAAAAEDDPALSPDGGVLAVAPLLSLEVPLGV
jgi:hypothetical protein